MVFVSMDSLTGTMSEEPEILPCPFCGGKGWVAKWNPSSYWSAGCSNCDVIFENQFVDKEDGIKHWNRRPSWERKETLEKLAEHDQEINI